MYNHNVFSRGPMRKSIVLSIAVLCCLVSVRAETHISGDIRTATLDATGNPYIVDQDVVVPAGKRLTIKEGCVLLFKGFTGINVFGTLTVAGTGKQPVIFTSINDGDFNTKSEQLPNPFDWNGILIARESNGATMQNFQLRYSVYGVKSQNTAVTIQSGIFRQNGQFHFTINDKIQYVQDNIAFSYSGNDASVAQTSQTAKESESGTSSSSASSPSKQQLSKGKLILRYSSLGVGVIGVVAGTVCLVARKKTLDERDAPDFKDTHKAHPAEDFSALTNKANGLTAGSVISYVLGGVGLVGFTLTFVF
jgi:hypothetical protein